MAETGKKHISFKGYSITPDSYTDPDTPGYWFPHAQVDGEAINKTSVALPPQDSISRELANEMAAKEAIRLIKSGEL